MTVVLKSSTYALTLRVWGAINPGPAPSFERSVTGAGLWPLFLVAIVSVIARSVIGSLQPRPHEVAGGDDSDRGGRAVCYDEAVDSAPIHDPGGLFEARGHGDGERRLGHDLPDRQAGPVLDVFLVGSSSDQVGLAQDTNQSSARVQDRKTSDLLGVQDIGGLREGSRFRDRDRVGGHDLANGSRVGHRAASAAGALALPAIEAVTSITPSYAPWI